MKFVFRADASPRIGTGHIMRCITLASELRRRGAECRFFCRLLDRNMLQRIQGEGFEAVALPDLIEAETWKGIEPWLYVPWQIDAEQTINALAGSKPDWLVVDHYGLDAQWEKALRPLCGRIMAIDDLADRQHDIDLLLDQNLVANLDKRYIGKLPEQVITLLGPRYALLQDDYAGLHMNVKPRTDNVRRILVYFGGADTADLTGRTIRVILGLRRNDIQVDIVGNSNNPFYESWQALAQAYGNLTLHESLESLAPIMTKADLAVGASGATSWERLCLGLPALVITLADNQRPIAKELHQKGLVKWIGHFDSVSDAEIAVALRKTLEKPLPPRWSRKCLAIVDGLGTRRVASVLLLQPKTFLKARPVTAADESLILEWANDPLVRRRSFDTNKIDSQTHKVWFQAKLSDIAECRYWILETDDGLPIGQVRFEMKEGVWEIHYGMSSLARGRGLGVRILETAIATFPDPEGTHFMGKVKSDNTPSIKIFKKLGFQGKEENGYWDFRKS
jgi:UDP-2,4-diacetamido-2,4,6-trideoxy-beta-L-altropyranose hydrolase